MQCPGCQHHNREGRRFCAECGASLALACPSCGFSNEPSEKFCGGCGAPLGASAGAALDSRFNSPESYTPKHIAEKILTSKAALEGERKQVTILFADLKGSMELLADRDPEEARKILDAVLERMMEAVHRYEGTVNQVMGDGIMALFGAPVAHEDHAARACYAALRMQESVKRYAEEARHAHGVSVQIRVGLNSGEVVVRAIGSDLRMDYTAVGQTTHLAARMEQLAVPGSIVVTSSTLALVEGLVAVTSLGRVPVKGIAEPLEVFEVTGVGAARTRLHAAARRGLTRFVGRDSELEQLWRAQEFTGKGRGQVAAVIGEAGVGKSRLVYEFTHSHRMQGWLVLEAASVSFGKATSYLPVIALLKGYFKIQDRDDLREIREKVTGKLLALDRALEPTLPALLSLLDVPVEDSAWQTMVPEQRRQQTLNGVKRLLLREAQEQPLVVIFEDLHWIDGETQALLDGLVESVGSAKLLLLVDYRPEYQHAWAGKTYYSQLRLDALPPAGAAELLDDLLGDDPSLASLKQLLVRRGNPFFVEESVRTLVETKALTGERGQYRLLQPITAIQIAPTVQTMLGARIDRLPSEEKYILQVASVIGKDVPFGLLREIAEESEEQLRATLEHLQAAELMHETTLFPELEYSFKHALTHEVTYGGMLQERRRTLHARIVDAIERLYPERRGEHTERLAYHAVRGGLGESAVRYLREAGRKAAARSAIPDALAWFEQALGRLATMPEAPATLQEAIDTRFESWLAMSNSAQPHRGRDLLRDAEALAERLGDNGRRGRAAALRMQVYGQLGQLDDALASGTRALEIAESLGDAQLRITATTLLQLVHTFRGDFNRVINLATRNLAALSPDLARQGFVGIGTSTAVYDRHWMVEALIHLGRFDEGFMRAHEALRLVAEPGHSMFSVANSSAVLGQAHMLRGEWRSASLRYEEALAVFRAGRMALQLPRIVAESSWPLAELGEQAAAQERIAEAATLLEAHLARGIILRSPWAYHVLARAALRLGEVDDAQRFAHHAQDTAACGYHAVAAWTGHALGDIAADRGDEAEAHYRSALALAEPRGMRPLVAHCHLGLGKLYRGTGRGEEAHEHLALATTMYREMDMRFWLEQAEVEIREA